MRFTTLLCTEKTRQAVSITWVLKHTVKTAMTTVIFHEYQQGPGESSELFVNRSCKIHLVSGVLQKGHDKGFSPQENRGK